MLTVLMFVDDQYNKLQTIFHFGLGIVCGIVVEIVYMTVSTSLLCLTRLTVRIDWEMKAKLSTVLFQQKCWNNLHSVVH